MPGKSNSCKEACRIGDWVDTTIKYSGEFTKEASLLPPQNLDVIDQENGSLGSEQDIFECSGTDSDPDYIPNSDKSVQLNKIDLKRKRITIQPSESSSEQDTPKRPTKKRPYRPQTWKKNIKKIQINSGKQYISRLGKHHAAKSVKPACNNCKFNCSNLINPDQRIKLFTEFYALADKQRQRNFMNKCMVFVEPKQKRNANAKRNKNIAYYFEIDSKRIRVCKPFFKSTLDLSNCALTTTIKKNQNGFLEPEKRGVKEPTNKTKEALILDVKAHIDSIPRMPSHYCRARTTKEYVEGSLNLTMLYNLYVEQCKTSDKPFVTKSIYSKIFNEEYNISFFKPKKDLCNFCTEFENMSPSDQANNRSKHDQHRNDIALSRVEKQQDKENNLPDTILAVFDLQAVIQLPSGNTSAFFYKSKLNAYNFTVYNVKEHTGHCFFWHEGIAKRGAIEIATFIYHYLLEHCQGKDVIFYSDNCGAQNKNKFLISMYIYAVQTSDVRSITHKYLITGHTNNEGDSMHACIEKEKKRLLKSGPIYVPSEIVSTIRLAKKSGAPYSIKEYETFDFIDWKNVSEKIGKNFSINNENSKCNWNEIKAVKITKEDPFKMFYKCSYNTDFKDFIDIRHKMRGRQVDCKTMVLTKAYNEPALISKNKKKDLESLCKSNAIPQRHHQFFLNLKAGENVSED